MSNANQNISEPTTEEWKALYRAAVEFQQIHCWDWMGDTDLLGVRNPETGEVGYCCVMGNAGQLFGLAVYLGTEGLVSYELVASGAVQPGDPNILDYQRCLMVTFHDRAELDGRDLAVIRAAGLKFRGSGNWPQFRSYQPCYLPWYLTADEARFLSTSLGQTVEVALRFKENNKLLGDEQPGLFLVRSARPLDDAAVWEDAFLPPAPLEPQEVVSLAVDEARLDRIKASCEQDTGPWEVDFFTAPIVIGDDTKVGAQRPFYPRVLLCVDKDSGFVFHSHLAGPDKYRAEFPDNFLVAIEQHGVLPRTVHVRNEELLEMLTAIAKKLGIQLRTAKTLRAVDQARRALFNFFETGG